MSIDEANRRIQEAIEQGATDLDLSACGLTALPDSIGRLVRLENLRLRENQLRVLPDSIGNLTQLQKLELGGNQLPTLPESIGNPTRLQELDLWGNRLQVLPDSIGNLTQLRKLEIGWNQLRTLPESIGNLTRLQELDLWGNRLQVLPDSIGNLIQLKELYLGDNQLLLLPNNISNLAQLEWLDLQNNPLTTLPDGLRAGGLIIQGCTHLRQLPTDILVLRLGLAGTGLTELPPSLRDVELYWHEVPIDAHIIACQPETITAEKVLSEDNVDLRRVLLERMGYERFVREANAEEIDQDEDTGGLRRVLRIDLTSDEPFVALVLIQSELVQQYTYMFRVPPDTQTCQQAAAWVGDFVNPKEYHPLAET